jgi:MFS family permease
MSADAAVSTSLRHEPMFVRWAAAEAVSWAGSAVTLVVLPLVVYELTGSAAQTGVLYAMRVVPYLLFGLVAGPIADRGNRRLLIIGGNIVEGVLMATIPVANAFGVLTVGQIYAVALLSATAFVFSDAAVFGAVPALVGPARLAAANGLLASVSSATEVIGPVLAGGLVALIGPAASVSVDAASFFVAAAMVVGIRSTFRSGDRADRRDVRSGMQAALRFVRERRDVATLLGVGFGNSFAFGAVLGLTVPYAVEALGFDKDDGLVGVLYAATGIGSLLSGLVFARLFRTTRVPVLTPLTLLVSGVLALVLARTTSWPVAALVFVAFAMSMSTTITIGITYRQLVAPDELRSSVNVIGRMISWGGQPFGAAVGALVAALASVPAAYTMSAAVMATSGVVARVLLRAAPVASVASGG